MSGTLTPLPLGYIEAANAPNLGYLLSPIQGTSISFEAIKGDLVTWATSKPDGVAWTEWMETDDGTIISEWIAGLAVFRKLAETMRMREASLDEAQLESSIFELAFNRGLLVPPAAAPILELSLIVATVATVAVNVGDFIGMQGPYELYSLEGKTLALSDTLRVAAGHLNVFTPAFSTLQKFKTFKIPLKDRYVARELESFVAAGVSIPLIAEPTNIGGFSNGFLLRRTVPSQVRIYVGNGVMGWYDPTVSSITYTCLSYGPDIATTISLTPQVVINAQLTDFTEVQAPSFDPDKETLRAITRYYPLDGRISQDSDYEAVIRKYYGGVLFDVLAYNSDPDQQILMLPNPQFGYGTPQAALQLAGIQKLVDGKRALGMNVFYTPIDPAQGQTFNVTMAIPAGSYSYTLQQQINALTAAQLYKFARVPTTLGAVDLATQLSAKYGVRFRPLDPTATITLGQTDFLSSFSIGLVTG